MKMLSVLRVITGICRHCGGHFEDVLRHEKECPKRHCGDRRDA